MTKYYEVKADHNDGTEIMYGSFVRHHCVCEIESEKEGWKTEGYKKIRIESRETKDQPDPEIYNNMSSDQA